MYSPQREQAPGHTADAAGLPLDEVTLAQNLADAGYFNAVMGKWQ